MQHEVICQVCGKHFLVYKFRLKAKILTCSIECKHKMQTGQNNPSYKNGLSTGSKGICELCGKEYIRCKHKQKYCSRQCKIGKQGKDNPTWKERPSYRTMHQWVNRNKPLTPCVFCGNTKVEAHNISGEYKRDIEDYQWVCKSCHKLKYPEKHRGGYNDAL